jgi:hypothetical protein
MRYPLWFPFPSCWLKALILEVSLIPLSIILRVVGESAFNALEVAWHDDRWRFWMWIAIAACLTPIFVLSHIHQFLWGEPLRSLPKWFPSPRSWIEGVWMWLVCLVAFTIPLFAFLTRYDLKIPVYLSPSEQELMSNFMSIGFFIVSAYLYHLRAILQKMLPKLGSTVINK